MSGIVQSNLFCCKAELSTILQGHLGTLNLHIIQESIMIASCQLTQTALPRFPLNSLFWVTFGKSRVEFGFHKCRIWLAHSLNRENVLKIKYCIISIYRPVLPSKVHHVSLCNQEFSLVGLWVLSLLLLVDTVYSLL